MSRWIFDGQSRDLHVGHHPSAMGFTQPTFATGGGNTAVLSYQASNSLSQVRTPTAANTSLSQGFFKLNASLDKALFDDSPTNGRPGVLVLGAGPTSVDNLESSVMHELQIASILKDTVGVSGNDIHVGFVRDIPSNLSNSGSAAGGDSVADSPSAFKNEVVSAFCQELNNTTLALQKAQANISRHSTLQRIGQINMSFTLSPKIGADVLFERLEYTDTETGKAAFGQLRRAVYGSSPSADATDRYQDALDYVQTLVSNSPEIKNAREAYNNQVRSLKENGVRCIVATGNENNSNHGANVRNGEAFNLFCTPDTINVAAATANGEVASFSSRSGKHNDTTPTLMALGQDVPIMSSLDTLDGDKNGKTDGTSFAAPQVAGLLSRLNQYSDLSADDEDAWLATLQNKGVIMDTKAPHNAEGMGWFHPQGVDIAA